MKSFLQILIETREAASHEAALHHARSAEHKKAADSFEHGSLEYHKAMAKSHMHSMMAQRAESKTKWRLSDRKVHVVKADTHFTKSMEHSRAANAIENRNG